MKAATPILRIFDEALAKDFYVRFLGFRLDWEHRFGEGFPLYAQVSRGACVLHLSGHYGDACPGSALRIETEALSDFCAQLRAKEHTHCKPGEPESQPWGTREITIGDPFGNRITFFEAAESRGELGQRGRLRGCV